MQWLEAEKNLLIEASRDHAKSWTLSCAYPLFRIQQVKDTTEGFRIALMSYSEDQAKDNLQRIRGWIETNPFLKWLMPPKGSACVWDARQLDCSNGCSIRAYGFNSSIRGQHPRIYVLDDPCKDVGGMPVEDQVSIFTGSVMPALPPGAQCVITGNPVDQKDFLEWVEGNKLFTKHFYPVYDDSARLLWPERYTRSDIAQKQLGMPAHKFAREYMLKRVSPADATFREEWIEYYKPKDLENRPLYKVMSIDPVPPSEPGKARHDALAACVTGTDADMNTFVIDRLSFRGDFEEGIGKLCDMMERNGPDFIGEEIFSFQNMHRIWLENELKKRGLSYYVEELKPQRGGGGEKTKRARIEALQPKLSQGKLFFLKEHKPMIDQLILWRPISKHNDDDEIDALAWQVHLWRKPYDKRVIKSMRPKPGTWGEAFEQSRMQGGGYLNKLFEDMVQ